MMDPGLSVRYIKGIGEARANSLSKLGIKTLRDLISYFPRTYEDRTKIKSISELLPGETSCIEAVVASTPHRSFARSGSGMELVKFRVVDDTGAVEITFFNQGFVRDQIKTGETYIFYGKNTGQPGRPAISNPIFEKPGAALASTGRIAPVYRLKAGLSQKLLIGAVRQGLSACAECLPDVLPEDVRISHKLAQAHFSYENIHFPSDFTALELARRRLVFEELFVLACALYLIKGNREKSIGLKFAEYDIAEFYNILPFLPTKAQRRAVSEAVADMCLGIPMNRLIQGDVGSGKTLVAAALIWYAWKNGFQSAFMVPTEILAGQHFQTMINFLQPHGIRVDILKGSMTTKQKKLARERLSLGETDLLIGTHALIAQDIQFFSLGLVITDEQHRFGVDQRSRLSKLGERPHVLVMSATPIPRTLALIIYGDLDISILNEMPPGRQKVETYAVGEEMRVRINRFIQKLALEGRQIFVVCPMIDENSENMPDVKSAEKHAEQLKETFPNLRVSCVHGKMRQPEKDEVMASFVAGETDILVSTTVIEVGVDIPNAALMIIENADRFGLSQLHQLRGRVGRGEHKSYCVLFSSSDGEESKARLRIMCETSNGFAISEEDLRLRGPGDFFGERQHGLPEVHIADIFNDIDILKNAQEAASKLMLEDPALDAPEHAHLLERICELFEIKGNIFN